MMMTDISKYNTFHLDYYKTTTYNSHHIRPSISTYDKIMNHQPYILEGCIQTYEQNMSLDEIILDSTIHGIIPDFISIYTDGSDRWCPIRIQHIDVHKYDMSKILNAVSLPQFHVVKNKNASICGWMVLDRHTIKSIDAFLSDDYSENDVCAQFKDYIDAVNYAKMKNSK